MEIAHLPDESGIYALVNQVTGERYVGQAKDIRRRVLSHLRDLRAGTHKTNEARVLQRAWDEYGEVNFEAVVLELVRDDRSVPYKERPDPLSLAEHYYIAEKSEYNADKRIVRGFEHLIEAKAWRKPDGI